MSIEKRLINGSEDTLQLLPIKYSWALEHYFNGCANNWLPQEVPLGDDLALWKSDALSEQERLLLKRTFGYFSTAESLVANNLSLAIYKCLTNAECRQYLLRQAFEETIHAQSFLYITTSLQLDAKEIYTMYQTLESIRAKDHFQEELTKALTDSFFSTATQEGSQQLLANLIGYYLIMEGIFFYGGFSMVLAFQRQKKMLGVCQIYEFILRDETIHLNFGIDLINGIIEENPSLWTGSLQKSVIENVNQAVDLETRYIQEVLPQGIFGLRPDSFRHYIEFLADRRLERIALRPLFGSSNPFDWMSEAVDLQKEKNFFEKSITEYRPYSSLDWDNHE